MYGEQLFLFNFHNQTVINPLLINPLQKFVNIIEKFNNICYHVITIIFKLYANNAQFSFKLLYLEK